MTVGTEEAKRLVVAGAGRLHGEASMSTPAPLFNRLALIGIGLIGSSIARAARAQGAARIDRRHRALAADAPARRRARPRRSGGGNQCRRGRGRRPRHRLHSGRRLRRGRQGDRRASRAGAIVSDVGSVKGAVDARHGPASAEERAFRAGASGRRHRIFRARRRLCRTVRQPLVHPDAARRHRCSGGREARRVLARCSAPMSRRWRPTTTTWCSRSPAICRI